MLIFMASPNPYFYCKNIATAITYGPLCRLHGENFASDMEGWRHCDPARAGLVRQSDMRPRPLRFVVRNALIRFRRMTPWRLVSDLRRAARLKRADPRRRAPHARDERLVVTLTTTPERGAALIPTLRSLLDQTWPADRIVIAWPEA